MRLDSSCR